MIFTALIDNIEYRIGQENFNITQQAASVSTSTLDVLWVAGLPVPRTLYAVEVLADGVPFFWGIITGVDSPTFSTRFNHKRYRLTVTSGETILNNRLVSETFAAGAYTHEIVQILFDNYIAAEGITLGRIDATTRQYANFNQSFGQLSQILSELADGCGCTYFISADKRFYFIGRNTFVQMPAPTHISELALTEETGDMRTVQIVTGATEETGTLTEGVYWANAQTVMSLGYSISEIVGVTITGVVATIGLLGVDDTNPDVTFLYKKGGSSLVLNSVATVKPATGNNVVCVYKGYSDIIVINSNDTLKNEINLINGTSGIIENIVSDTTIKNFADAENLAQSLLNQYSEREQTLTCSCRSLSDTELYNLWAINKPELNIVGEYVVVERSVSAFGVGTVWIKVTLKNKNYFARYGTVFIEYEKEEGETVKVYKTGSFSERITAIDSFVFMAQRPYYPSSSQERDTMLGGFYPI